MTNSFDPKHTAIVYIDLTTEEGIRTAQDLEDMHSKSVRVDFPLPESITGVKKWYTFNEVIEMQEKKFNEHYGTNYKFKRYGK